MIGLIITALVFIDTQIRLKITLGFIGLSFIILGLVQLKQEQERKENEEGFNVMLTKLDEIQQEPKKEDKSKGTEVVVADILSSGLKYYTDSLIKQKKKEEKE